MLQHNVYSNLDSTELVAYKPTHKDNFVLLLESMKDHLTYLECDPKFLAISDLPVLKADYFKSSQTSGQGIYAIILTWTEYISLWCRN